MGEAGEIEVEAQGVAFGFHRAPVYIHTIADALKGIEADAQRQRQGQHRQVYPGQGVGGLGQKARVFIEAQQYQVCRDHPAQQRAAGPFTQRQTKAPVYQGKGSQQQAVPDARPGTEAQTEHPHDHVPGPGRQDEIRRHCQRQEHKQELNRIKAHPYTAFR